MATIWKWQGDKLNKAPLPGIPGRNLSEEEFAAASARMDQQNPDDLGALARSGLYRKVSSSKTTSGSNDETVEAESEG